METLIAGPHKGAIRAPRGTKLSTKGWQQEAALRMLMNNLDPEVAEAPEELVVYGGTGKAARDWPSFHAIVRALESLENDETLLIQSGKPVGILRTHAMAPRVLIANANLVGKWSSWEVFRELEQKGLMMYGQMTAGSWIYIGSQGIVQGTYETFAAAGRKHFGGSLEGKLIVSGGMGGMGGAQPLAATMTGARFLGIDVDPKRIQKRVESGYCDCIATSVDEALQLLAQAGKKGTALSVGLVGNAADVLPELLRRNIIPEIVTDQTSAHDPLNGYVPNGMSLEAALALRQQDSDNYVARSMATMGKHIEAMLELKRRGSVVFDYGNNLRTNAKLAGVEDAFDIPGFVPEYIRPSVLRRQGAFPLGRALRRSGRHSQDRSAGVIALSWRRSAQTLDQAGWRAHSLPGSACSHLLAGLRPTGEAGSGDERAGAFRRNFGADRDWPRPS